MILQFTVTVEVSDETATLVDRMFPGVGAAGGAQEILKCALQGAFKNFEVRPVTTSDSYPFPNARSNAPARSSVTAQLDAHPEVYGPHGASQAAQDAKSGYPFPNKKSNTPEGPDTEEAPTPKGRPKTLHDREASDGGVVREWGPRGVAELRKAGIKVTRKKGSSPNGQSTERPQGNTVNLRSRS